MMGKNGCTFATLSPFALGLALGVIKGVCLIVLAYAAWIFGFGMPMVEHVASYYHGYHASFVGGLVGGVYGLVGGFIFGYVYGFLYNFFMHRCCGKDSE